ncbi:MAG: hypothetical protein AAGK17_05275 [Pseudomonadota bacterium]
MSLFEMHVVFGTDSHLEGCKHAECANDNVSREQEFFELSVSRELVDDCD